MGNAILVDDRFIEKEKGCSNAKCESCSTYPCKTYSTLINALKKGLELRSDDIWNFAKFEVLDNESKEDLWKSIRVFCLHTDTLEYTIYFKKAVDMSIPVIVMSGANVNQKAWINLFQQAGWKDVKNQQFNLADKMFYINHSDDVRGAVKWIIHYYWRFRETIIRNETLSRMIGAREVRENGAALIRNDLSY